uniref:Uncharacterized protein n=1 Tax=Denticeps clupeoides TaxID=299321 RepID=A0AAY4F148_9TELE
MLQRDNAWPHIGRICTQLREAENTPALVGPAYSMDMSPIEHMVWDELDRRVKAKGPTRDRLWIGPAGPFGCRGPVGPLFTLENLQCVNHGERPIFSHGNNQAAE